jgi:endoglucanase
LYYSSQRTGIDARDVTPLITWSPGPDFSPSTLLAGGYDSYLIAQARAAKAWGRPIMVRMFHEMNGTWNSYGYTKQSPADFVASWRHVVDIFRAQGVTNVSWVWSPNIYGFGQTAPFDAYYPGDAYVDWVALDGYNYGTTWRSFAQLYTASYNDITGLSAKPLMVAEWGCSPSGGNEAAWITDAFVQVATAMPRIRAIVAFDHSREADFRVDSSSAVLSAYQGGIALLRSLAQ